MPQRTPTQHNKFLKKKQKKKSVLYLYQIFCLFICEETVVIFTPLGFCEHVAMNIGEQVSVHVPVLSSFS
jgi:hypothetical protein